MASRFFLCEILNYVLQAERKWYQIVTSLHGVKWRAYKMVNIWGNIRFYIYFIYIFFFFSAFFKNTKFFESLTVTLFCWVCYMWSFMCLLRVCFFSLFHNLLQHIPSFVIIVINNTLCRLYICNTYNNLHTQKNRNTGVNSRILK